MTPDVTIYMPTHNRVRLLREAVDSVFSQTYKNWVLHIVDDGSSDGTAEFLADVARDSRVVATSLPKSRGACAARNIAINNAKTPYITGLDDDDLFKPSRVENMLNTYRPEYSFLCETGIKRDPLTAKLARSEIKLSDILYRNCVGNPVFTETEKLRAVGGFDTEFGASQDYDLWIRLIWKFGSARRINADSYIIRTQMGCNRITDSRARRLLAQDRLLMKYGPLMSSGHKRNHIARREWIETGELSLPTFIRSFNLPNCLTLAQQLARKE